MIPTLKQVAASLVKLCRSSDVFTPSMLRQLLGRDFSETEAGALSAQIQPHLRALRQAGAIALIQTHQRRNRPYRVTNRELLVEISLRDDYYVPIAQHPDPDPVPDEENDETDDQDALTKDATLNLIIEMERRIIALEETVDLLVEKLGAVSTLLRHRIS